MKYRVHSHTHWEKIEQKCGRCGGDLFQEVAKDGTMYPYFACSRAGCTWADYHVDALMAGEVLPVPSGPKRYAVWLEDDDD